MTTELSLHCLCDNCGSDECQAGEESTEYLVRNKVLDELVSRIDNIPILLIGPGVIYSPTIKYVKDLIEEIRREVSE